MIWNLHMEAEPVDVTVSPRLDPSVICRTYAPGVPTYTLTIDGRSFTITQEEARMIDATRSDEIVALVATRYPA